MFLITNLSKEAFNANCIKTLYTMRWRVETVFKEMKQHCFFQSCNSRNINPALILLYSSLICYQLKTFLYNQAAVECLQSNEDDENCIEYSFDAIMEHLKAASLGITRKFFELKTCLQMFRARAKGLETHVKCVLSVLVWLAKIFFSNGILIVFTLILHICVICVTLYKMSACRFFLIR